MKFSTTLALALVPFSMAAKVRRSLPVQPIRRGAALEAREHGQEAMKDHGYTANSKTEIIIIWANPGGGDPTTTYAEKMTVTETVTVGGAETAAPPAAATHTVIVGGPGGLIFQPDQLENVPVGDMVIFEFLSQNHTVTQSPFDTPCEAIEGGMNSGFQPNPNNTITPAPQVAMQVTGESPLWFYCAQGNHCGAGMVFSINPTADKTQAMFKEKAIAQNGDGAATPITGGPPASPPVEAPPAEAPPAEAPPAEAPPAEAPPADAPPADAPPAEAPPVDAPAPGGEENTGAVPGKGVVGEDGSCICMVSCSATGFPAVNAQGIGAVGGLPGSLPARMAFVK